MVEDELLVDTLTLRKNANDVRVPITISCVVSLFFHGKGARSYASQLNRLLVRLCAIIDARFHVAIRPADIWHRLRR